MKKQKLNKKYKPKHKMRNFVWITLGVLVLIGLGYATTIISNSPSGYLTSDNITINNTGAFSNGYKMFTRQYDYIFCQAPPTHSKYQSLLKECDYVCGNDNCGRQIESILNSSNYSSILFRNSITVYNITTRIDFDGVSNLVILGEGPKTI